MKYVPVSLTEEFILNYSALPEELNNWRYYRIEYNGHAEACVMERPIMLPRFADAYIFDLLFDHWQEKSRSKRRKSLHKIILELERGMAWMDKTDGADKRNTEIPAKTSSGDTNAINGDKVVGEIGQRQRGTKNDRI